MSFSNHFFEGNMFQQQFNWKIFYKFELGYISFYISIISTTALESTKLNKVRWNMFLRNNIVFGTAQKQT